MVLIAVGQICSSANLAENAIKVINLINKASNLGCKILFLPEASDYIAKNSEHSKQIAESINESKFLKPIQKQLKYLNSIGKSLFISVGIHEPSLNSDRVKNILLYLNENGEIEQKYQKLHLFDVDIKNGPILKESLSVEPGMEILKPFDSPIGKIGSGICYDIRFPELSLRLRSMGADILLFPSAFTMKTGAAHWELLARSRAIDTQCFVIMAAQSGKHKTQTDEELQKVGKEGIVIRESYGHAMVVDPWGTVISQCTDIGSSDSKASKEDMCIADIDLDKLQTVRRDMPLWEQRRPDVFGYDV
ncbi:hypothetical protein B5S28_g3806 [[Candida] boidinii]|uniref:Unnamed protein product n=1 Tax=Candida boidinii TaxID=5477 RepID=A0ACB5TW12_CANBO|nr:hypothetical protein B5S28_g3806 [[Candida] boidinii]OWB64156.1 hypothetical protein B5S29_g5202 [[Candida] boidinii]OWB74754.1 hypothetical protein B5S31_g4573 [[Candida] boidinii]OWB80371.1 hypothetical protein B5S32_g4640 [[Candida] boidinii]GME76742.1 unnamed protein product [[Candida] boidinii]